MTLMLNFGDASLLGSLDVAYGDFLSVTWDVTEGRKHRSFSEEENSYSVVIDVSLTQHHGVQDVDCVCLEFDNSK